MSRSGAIPLSDLSSRTSYHGPDSRNDKPFDRLTHIPSRDTLHTKSPNTHIYRPESLIDDDKGNIAQGPTLANRSLYEHYVTDSWGMEILSWLVAALMLTILLIFLAAFDQKSLSQWHSRLSLNTIIAVLSQLVQACLLLPIARGISQLQWLWYRKNKPLADMSYFDEGSRGLIDSLLLLSKRYTSLLVWLGVIPMILQAFIGPFAQQALSLPERQVKHGDAFIPRVILFDSTNEYDEGVIVAGRVYPDVPLHMRMAISTGLSRDGITHSEVQGWSSTGNSTFDPFTSIGVCASAEDVTSTIILDCPKGTSDSTVSDDKCNATVQGLRDSPPYESFPTHMSAKDGNTLWIGSSRYKPEETSNSSSYPGSTAYQGSRNTLIEFYVIYLTDMDDAIVVQEGDAAGRITVAYAKNKLGALKGTLSLCSYTYNSSIEFGHTKTSILDRNMKLNWRNGIFTLSDAYNETRIVANTSDGSETVYYFDPQTITGLNVLLASSKFTGTAQMMPPFNLSQHFVLDRYMDVFSGEASKAIARHLYDDGGTKVTDGVKALSELLDNLATSMTNGSVSQNLLHHDASTLY